MLNATEGITTNLAAQFDRYISTLLLHEGHRYSSPVNNAVASEADIDRIRDEVLANATGDDGSLAYQILARYSDTQDASRWWPACDAAVRLAWGASPTRRALGLPATNDLDLTRRDERAG